MLHAFKTEGKAFLCMDRPRSVDKMFIFFPESISWLANTKSARVKMGFVVGFTYTMKEIGSSVCQIAISETSRKQSPPVNDHLSLTSRVVAYWRFHCISNYRSTHQHQLVLTFPISNNHLVQSNSSTLCLAFK